MMRNDAYWLNKLAELADTQWMSWNLHKPDRQAPARETQRPDWWTRVQADLLRDDAYGPQLRSRDALERDPDAAWLARWRQLH